MRKKYGFTLVELLAVIVILGILISLSIVAIGNLNKTQKIENKRNTIISILSGARQYFAEKPNSPSVDVRTLKREGFVDFDENKTDYISVNTIIKYNDQETSDKRCSKDIKRALYIITVDGRIYNDCGCSIQDDANAVKLCSGYNETTIADNDPLKEN